MSRPAKDYTGHRFGFWTVLRFDEVVGSNRYWICKCDCGTERRVPMCGLSSGHTKSCGCGLHKIGPFEHGLAKTPIYESWRGMKKRCLNRNHHAYHNYGGRGIRICRSLLDSPMSIIECIGQRPDGMTLDRKDNEGHYSCGACIHCKERGWPMNLRWATKTEQARNARFNRIVEIDGQKRPACEWADRLGIERNVFYSRLYSGKTGQALTGPLQRIRRK